MQWLYNSNQNEQKVATEADLPRLVSQGSIRSDTLVWNSQLTDWTEASQVLPSLFPPASPISAFASPQPIAPVGHSAPIVANTPSDRQYRDLAKILAQASGWLQFLGVIYALNFIAIVPIFLAVKCFAISSSAKTAAKSGSYAHLQKTVKEIKNLFILQGAMTLVAFVIYAVIWLVSFTVY